MSVVSKEQFKGGFHACVTMVNMQFILNESSTMSKTKIPLK